MDTVCSAPDPAQRSLSLSNGTEGRSARAGPGADCSQALAREPQPGHPGSSLSLCLDSSL